MTERPRVSVILPVRNESAAIASTLDAILSQDYDGEIEVHVVDGESTDGTQKILDHYSEAHPQIKWSVNPGGLTARSLNLAIRATRGPVVVRCDGRSRLPASYITNAVRVLAATGAACVGGVQRAVGVRPVQRAVAMATTSVFGAGNARFRVGGRAGPVDTVYLGVFRRDQLEALGGFDERFVRNQDAELNSRIRENGGVVYFTPELVVDYQPRGRLGPLARQYLEYGRWRRETSRIHPDSRSMRQMAPPALVVALAASLVALVLGLSFLGSVVPVVYTVFLAAATIVLAVRTRDLAALLIPAVLAVIHASWGVGYLMGPPR